ncbi:Transcription factor [Aspergillus sclerotialis]|uniref:Transcription factor n=1 Tax=Aspergillus sclerotialis TaxID=2070753 RepID=A0A3A2ZQD0_9EURO|nr:Transcription factor [Aspergillus sclerotialis]
MSSVSARKKSAFSCDRCRKRKVKCGGEQPHCARCIARNELCEYKLTPTLSYTQSLENRVKELEDHLSNVQANGYVSSIRSLEPPLPGTSVVAALPQTPAKRTYSGAVKGLKVDAKGAVTFHGTTSFFQLPTSNLNEALGTEDGCVEVLCEVNQRKKKLVSNAWHQRALETISGTPVG